MSERQLRVNEKGLAVFRTWSALMAEAERAGETVPSLTEPEAAAEWLDGQGILGGIPRDEACSLLKIMAAGGEGEFMVLRQEGDENGG